MEESSNEIVSNSTLEFLNVFSAPSITMKKLRLEKALNLFTTPRFIGKDHIPVMNIQSLKKQLAILRSKMAIPFISIYRANKLIPLPDSSLYPSEVEIDKIVFDFDSPLSPSNSSASASASMFSSQSTTSLYTITEDDIIANISQSQLAVQKFIKYLYKKFHFTEPYPLPLYIVFSGMKGFHVYIKIRPKIYRIVPNDNYQQTTDKLYSLQVAFDPKRLSDSSLHGILTGMIRIPNERYVGKTITLDTYSIPLTEDEIMELDPVEIYNLAKSPRKLYVPVYPDEYLPTLDDLISLYEIEIKTSRVRVSKLALLEDGKDTAMPVFPSDTPTKEMLDDLLKFYPCIANIVKTDNPPHRARVYFVLHLAHALLSPNPLNPILTFTPSNEQLIQIEEFIEMIIANLNWSDYNPLETHKQVKSIVFNLTRYKPPRCRKLKLEGFCIGNKCPYYNS